MAQLMDPTQRSSLLDELRQQYEASRRKATTSPHPVR
jgi:hypothetical protein